jgi:hypothetical protein
LIDANAQKLAKAGSADEEEIAKATKSVNDVTEIEAPDLANARAPLFTRLSSSSESRGTPSRSLSNALAITNASSTPIPSKTNGSTECTGPYSNPANEATPKPATVLSATSISAEKDIVHLDPRPQSLEPMVAPKKINATI